LVADRFDIFGREALERYGHERMSALVVSVAHKHALGKQRRQRTTELNAQLDKRLRASGVAVGGEVHATPGCFDRLASCLSLRFLSLRKAQRFSKLEVTAMTDGLSSATSVASAAASVGAARAASVVSASSSMAKSGLVSRLVGKAKASEAVRLEAALASVETRMVALQERADAARKAAVAAKRTGKNAEAIAQLKKAKAAEKQLATVGAALAALEQQRDMLEETALHRELASTLASTNKSVKAKTKGLLGAAEKASDEAVELRDDVEDVGSAFESLIPSSSGPDDDDLLDELEQLVEEAAGVPMPAPQAPKAVTAVVAASVPANVPVATPFFPTAPADLPTVREEEEGPMVEVAV
jgi:hypothetical protein